MARRKRKTEQPDVMYQAPLGLRIAYRIWMFLWTLAKIAIGVGGIVVAAVAVTGIIFVCLLGNYLQEDVIPNADFNVEGYKLDQTSFIYYKDQGEVKLLQQIYTVTDRQWVTYDDIPQNLIRAAVAIEDKRFYEHQGVDWFRTVAACGTMFLGGDTSFGGSTITQQLIKNVTQEDDVTVRRKVLEIFRALQFEQNYTKEEILEWYLNVIYLGEGCNGVQSAAKHYFGKDVQELTIAECASLVSITNNPSLYDPYVSMERNRKRQLLVLEEMLEQEYITQAQYDEAVAQEMVFTSKDPNSDVFTCTNCGFSSSITSFTKEGEGNTYVCPICGEYMEFEVEEENPYYSYYVDAVLADVARDLQEKTGYSYSVCMQMIKTGGYHIYANIDMEVQKQVDQIYTDLEALPTTASNQQLQSSIVIVDNETGDLVALAGGVGRKETYLGYNRATQARLQPGSSLKPLTVYSPALELGRINPGTPMFDGPLYDRYPLNESRTYSGMTTVLNGVAQSLNTIAVRTLDNIGSDYSFDFAKNRFGLSTLEEGVEVRDEIMDDKGYSSLGMGQLTFGVTVRDMTAAYATFANNGVWREPRTYSIVYDGDGNVVLDNTQESRDILSPDTVLYMNYMLQYAVDMGTGTPARLSGMNAAGKTGTSNNNCDRWFAGYTPYYTAVVWCGYDLPEQVVLTGVKTNPASRLWKAVMGPLHEGLENRSLFDGSRLTTATICSESGLLATDACKKDPRGDCCITVRMLPKHVPSGRCDQHVMVAFCTEGHGVANEFCKLAGTAEEVGLVKFTEKQFAMYRNAGVDVEEAAYTDEKCKLHSITSWLPTDPTLPTNPTTDPTGGG